MFDEDVVLLFLPRQALDLAEVEKGVKEVFVNLDRKRLQQDGAVLDKENAVLC